MALLTGAKPFFRTRIAYCKEIVEKISTTIRVKAKELTVESEVEKILKDNQESRSQNYSSIF